KVSVISSDGKLVAVAGTQTLDVLSYPSLERVAVTIITEKEIYDATFSNGNLVIATTEELLVYALPEPVSEKQEAPSNIKNKGKQKADIVELELVQKVLPPAFPGSTGSTFRAARFHPENNGILYTMSNTIPGRTKGRKAAPRLGYVCKWNATTWKSEKVKKVSDKGLTCFAVSLDGTMIAFGSSDCSIGLLDATTLNPLMTILKAHEFPPTTLTFNPTSKLLVSGSADNTIRVIGIPEDSSKYSWTTIILILITLLIALVALLAQQT
ncbi:unnamed protein product, partial [Mycena citricolor]